MSSHEFDELLNSPLGSNISFVKKQNSRGINQPTSPPPLAPTLSAYRYTSSRGSSGDDESKGSSENNKYVSFAEARACKELVDIETDSLKEKRKLGPDFDGETLVRINAHNDEVLEDMYRKELQEYYDMQCPAKRLKSKNDLRTALILMIAVVATAVAITTIILTVKQQHNSNSAGGSSSDVTFQEKAFDGYSESDVPLKTELAFVSDEKAINASTTTTTTTMNEKQYKAQHVSCHKISTFFESATTTSSSSNNNKEQYDIRFLIDDACDKGNMMTNPETFIKCQMMCASKMCCFSQSPDDNCYDTEENNKLICDLYSSCRTLLAYDSPSSPTLSSFIDNSNDGGGEEVEDDGMINVSNNNIDEICSEESLLSNDGFGTCQRICSSRACCFISGDCNCYNIAAGSSSWCDKFQGCRHLLDAEPHMR